VSKLRVNYDAKSDVLYLVIKEGREEAFIEVADGINVELGPDGELLGIEILNASKLMSSIKEAQRIARQAA